MWLMLSSWAASSRSSFSSSVSVSPLTIFMNRPHRRRASSTVSPVTRSAIISADACETAQPWPVNAASSMTPFSMRSFSTISSPQLGFTPSCSSVAPSMSYL